jgi:alkylation response protein AidB-like acyl-CoA dehydrogenase
MTLLTRTELQAWLAEHPDPTGPALAGAGLVAPHWPAPWGLDADPTEQLMIAEELHRAAVGLPSNPIGIGWAGPTIVAGGTPEQQQRWLPGILDGSMFFCQLFSEPGAGSDLAGLTTRAERDGDTYVVTGQKIWSTWADHADWGILLARTDPTVAKQKGITYFVVDMRSAGIEVRPIRDMTGLHHFNEVFLTDVSIPADQRIGAEGDGWRLAKVTLANERVSLSEGGVLWGMGPTSTAFMAGLPPIHDPVIRQRAAAVYTATLVQQRLRDRILAARQRGEDAGGDASIKKTLADVHGQHVMALAKDIRGTAGMLAAPDDEEWGYLFSRALTIGGGTSEVQRNIIGERLLGLPRDP